MVSFHLPLQLIVLIAMFTFRSLSLDFETFSLKWSILQEISNQIYDFRLSIVLSVDLFPR
jgi:hypothetical protein